MTLVTLATADAALSDQVRAELEAQGFTAGKIEVSTAHGTVALDGEVESPAERRRAERVARAVAGVQGVHNRLSVAAAERDRQAVLADLGSI